MKKAFKITKLDCASCATKMERSINKIDGVQSANINFVTSKLILEADDNRFDDIVLEVEKACQKIEKGAKLIKI